MADEQHGQGHSLSEFKSKFAPDEEVQHLRAEVKDLERRLEEQRKLTGEARLNMIKLSEAIEVATPGKMVYKAGAKAASPVTCVMHITDLHWGAVVDPNEIEGFGEFSPAIAEDRIRKLGAAVLSHVKIERSGFNIDSLHIIGTADYVSGDIHQELQITNAYPSPRQAVEAGYAIGELANMMAPHFNRVTADLLTLDNHGRITKKPQASQGGENNWSYVAAHIAKQHCRDAKNVVVNIHATPTMLVAIGPERYLCFHGHQIRGWAGLPYYGFDRRTMMEAVKRMGVPEARFTKIVMGHFHTAANAPNWIIGGSLYGTDANDHSCGRYSRPHQTSWLVHDKHGEFGFTRWWL